MEQKGQSSWFYEEFLPVWLQGCDTVVVNKVKFQDVWRVLKEFYPPQTHFGHYFELALTDFSIIQILFQAGPVLWIKERLSSLWWCNFFNFSLNFAIFPKESTTANNCGPGPKRWISKLESRHTWILHCYKFNHFYYIIAYQGSFCQKLVKNSYFIQYSIV